MKILVKIIILIVLFSYSNSTKVFAQDKIKLGLLVPISGEFSEIGKSIIKSTLLAVNKIIRIIILTNIFILMLLLYYLYFNDSTKRHKI